MDHITITQDHYNAIANLPVDLRAEVYDAVFGHFFADIEPKLSPAAFAVFLLIRRDIESAPSPKRRAKPRAGGPAIDPATADGTEESRQSCVIELPLNDGTMCPIRAGKVEEWSKLYLAVDIEQELRKMRGWLDASPDNRKTKRGIYQFVVNWLSREQDRAKKQQPEPPRYGGAPRKAPPIPGDPANDKILQAFMRGD